MATPLGSTQVSRRKALVADVLLFSVAIFWGSNFVFIKDVVERTTELAAGSIVAGTMLYLVLRYVIATGVLAVIQPRSWLKARRGDWARGSVLGALYLTALVLQTIGLQRTSPGVSGFITGMNIAMVPFLYWLFAKRSPGRYQIVGAVVLATIGLAALSLQGDFTLSGGDSLTLIGALLYALHIMATGFYAPKVRAATLAFTQIAFSTVALLIVTPFVTTITFDLPWEFWAAVVWTAISGTIYAFFIQSWAQRYTTSTHAAILLGFESVFAAIAGIIAGMDSVTWRLLVGGSMMLTGVLHRGTAARQQGDRRRDRGRRGGGAVSGDREPASSGRAPASAGVSTGRPAADRPAPPGGGAGHPRRARLRGAHDHGHLAGLRGQPRARVLLLRRQGRSALRAGGDALPGPRGGVRGGDPRVAARPRPGRRASRLAAPRLGARPHQPDALRAAAPRAPRPGGPGAVRRGVPHVPRRGRGLPGREGRRES